MILCVSPAIGECVHQCGCKAEFIPLGVDMNKFHPVTKEKKKMLRKKYEIPQDKFIILHLGHINYGRNLSVLKSLQRDDNQAIIVSSTSTPEDTPKDITLQKELESEGIVIFDKYIDSIEEVYQLSDCYAFPVTLEQGCIGIPLSVLEAMAMTKPIITTNAGGISEIIINDQTGWIVPMLSPTSIAKKIIYCMENKTKASELGKNARQLVLEKYTNTRMVETLERLYLQCGLE